MSARPMRCCGRCGKWFFGFYCPDCGKPRPGNKTPENHHQKSREIKDEIDRATGRR